MPKASAAYVYANCDVHDGEIEYPDSGCAKCREESEARSAACIHTPARCNGGGYDGCACGPYPSAAWIRGLRRWAWSLVHNGPRWTFAPRQGVRRSALTAASSYPSAGELLDAIEALLHWRVLATNENQGGLWFYDPEGMGTKPLGPDEIMSMYEKEAKARD